MSAPEAQASIELQSNPAGPVTPGRWEPPSRAGVRRLLLDQGAWLVLSTLAWAFCWFIGVPAPQLAGGLALGLGVAAMRPKRALLAPAMLAACAVAALGAHALDQSFWMGAGLAAGGLGALNRVEDDERDGFTALNGALAGAAMAGIGAWVADTAGLTGTVFEGAMVALFAVQGLWPSTLRWKKLAAVPTPEQVRSTLTEAYHPPVLRALDLFVPMRDTPHDADTLEGLAEIIAWVYRLALSLQTLDRELDAVPLEDLARRVGQAAAEAEATEDPFIRERRLATVSHLQQLMRHVELLRLERQRTASLQDYALAYLEEARLGLLVARALPGESTPVRLTEVLGKLRDHAREGDARRRTARELHSLRT